MGTAQLQNSSCRMTLVFDREAGFLTAKVDRALAHAAHPMLPRILFHAGGNDPERAVRQRPLEASRTKPMAALSSLPMRMATLSVSS